MFKLAVLKTVFNRTTGRSLLLLKKHSPEILMGIGVIGTVVSTVMACKATLKAEGVIAEAKEKLEKVKRVNETVDKEKYTELDYKKDLTVVYAQTAVDFIKLYGPSLVIGLSAIGCMLSAHGIMRKRNLAIIAAYKAVEESFAKYRKRIVEDWGIEKDFEYKNGIRHTLVNELDGEGKPTEKINVVTTLDPNAYSQYARFFDEASTQWQKLPEYNQMFLKCQQNHANDLLHSRGHVFLNEIYDMIGVPRSKEGAVVGWVRGAGDDFVDFGIFTNDNERVRDFVNGYNRSILLDFNVDGVIYDLI